MKTKAPKILQRVYSIRLISFRVFAVILSLFIFNMQIFSVKTYASSLPNPDPNFDLQKYLYELVTSEAFQKAMMENKQELDSVRTDTYKASITSKSYLSQNVDAMTLAGALQMAYQSAGFVAENGPLSEEYEMHIQYIKDNNVLPDHLDGLDANILFVTIDYADMTLGYYCNEAGEKIGQGYVKFKQMAQDAVDALCNNIKDTFYWSKPFKNIDGNTYEFMQCVSSGNGVFWVENFNTAAKELYRDVFHIKTYAHPFYNVNNRSLAVYTNFVPYTLEEFHFTNGKLSSHSSNSTIPTPMGNGWYKCGYGIFGSASNQPYNMSVPFPHITNEQQKLLEANLRNLKDGDFDTSQTGIKFFPAVVPAYVPNGGKAYVDSDVESYVDGCNDLDTDATSEIEIPYSFPEEVPFPEYTPEVAPELYPDYQPSPDPDPSPSPDPDPSPSPDPDPSPSPDPDPSPSPNPDPSPSPDPDPSPSPNPDPSPLPDPDPSPSPDPDPSEETDLDIPSAVGTLSLMDKFPFCVPHDLVEGIKLFNADPVTPEWSWVLKVNGTPIEYTWTISLEKFENVAKLCRTLLTILFVWGLAKVTREVIKG